MLKIYTLSCANILKLTSILPLSSSECYRHQNIVMSTTLRSQVGVHLLPHKESKRNYTVAFHRCYWRKVGLQWIKRKGAILVLVWFLLLQSGYYLIRHTFIWKTTASNIAVPIIGFMIMIIFSPIAGWLADVHFGQYNVIKWSILIA